MSIFKKRLKDASGNTIYPQTTTECVYDTDNNRLDTLLQNARIPIGTIVPFGGSTVPSGWLECNGIAVNRTVYAQLFSVIGTTYGAGDGSTTFNLPKYETQEQKKLLWTNPRPTSSFASQTVSLSLSGYDWVEIIYVQDTTVTIRYNCEKLQVGKIGSLKVAISNCIRSRVVTVNTSGVQFAVGSYWDASLSSPNTDNTKCVPYQIYGIQKASGTSTKHIIKANNNSISEPVSPTIEQRIGAIESDISSMQTYSTTEQAIGTWIDGKPLYRKVLTKIGTGATSYTMAHNISNVYQITKADICAISGTGSNVALFPQSNPDYPWALKQVNATNIQWTSKSAYGSEWTFLATIEYTKTTD